MRKFLDSVKKFIDKEKQNKKSILFWIPFSLILFFSIIMFVTYKVSIIGWLIAIILFLVVYIFRNKIFVYTITIQLVALCVFVIILGLVVITTKDKGNSTQDTVSKTPLVELSFDKTYDLPQNKGTYATKISTNKTENKYELELVIYALTSILPNDFIFADTNAKSYMREGITIYELDQMEIFVTSSDSKEKYYSHGPLSVKLEYSSGTTKVADIFPSTFKFSFNSKERLIEFINKYDILEIYRYNIGEVGINDFKVEHNADGSYIGSYGYNAEKAYKLHPILLEVPINWNDLRVEIN